MKNFLKNLFYKIALIFTSEKRVVLMYHSVGENDKFSTVKPAEFAKQIEYISWGGLKNITVTFDDGFRDNYRNAYPILKKFNVPAIIFINTANIGKSVTTKEGLEMEMLSEQEIKEMLASGLVKFGSHGHHHRRLSQLNEEEIENELKTSKELLENILGAEVDSVAYPHGDCDERVKLITKKYYKFGYGNKPGAVNSITDTFLIPRNSIDAGVDFGQFKGIVKIGKQKFNYWKK